MGRNGRSIERVDPRIRRALNNVYVGEKLYKGSEIKITDALDLVTKEPLKISVGDIKVPKIFINAQEPLVTGGLAGRFAMIAVGLLGLSSMVSSLSYFSILSLLASTLLPLGSIFLTFDGDITEEYVNIPSDPKDVIPGFYGLLAQKDLSILQGVLDYAANKHGYGVIPEANFLDEVTQELQEDRPLKGFYPIYNGNQTVMAHDKDPKEVRFRYINETIWEWAMYNAPYDDLRFDGRFYIVVEPSLYLQNLERITEAVKKTGVSFKTSNRVQLDGSATRRDHIVIYFSLKDGPAVYLALSSIMDKMEAGTPGLFSEKGPYLTMKLRNGLFFGEESPVEDQSVGSLRSRGIEKGVAEMMSLIDDGAKVTPGTRALIIAHFLEEKGVDAENPAFNKGGIQKFGFLFRSVEDLRNDPSVAGRNLKFTKDDGDYLFLRADLGLLWPKGSDRFIIGNDLIADLNIEDEGISKRHFLIQKKGSGTYTLRDDDQTSLVCVDEIAEDGSEVGNSRYIGKLSGFENKVRYNSYSVDLDGGKVYRLWIVFSGLQIYIKLPE